jgi:hypothetical protein
MPEASAPLTIEQLLEAIKHLSPADRRELHHRFLAWQDDNGRQMESEAELRQAARARLPALELRRLRRLTTKSKRGTLTAEELAEYRLLARRAEQLDVARAEALAELGRRRGRQAPGIRTDLGGEGDADGA